MLEIDSPLSPRHTRRSASPGPGPSTLQSRRYLAGPGSESRMGDGTRKVRGRREGEISRRQEQQPGQEGGVTGSGSGTEGTPIQTGTGSVSSTRSRPLFFSGTASSTAVPTPQPYPTGTTQITGSMTTTITSLTGANDTLPATAIATGNDTVADPAATGPLLTPSSNAWTPTATAALPGASTLAVYVPVAGQPLEQGQNGLIANMSLGGDDIDQSVYSVPVVFGHASTGQNSRRLDKRAGNYQTMRLAVDLGSSDMWIAASTCTTSDCKGSGVRKFNAGLSIDSGQYINLQYHQGSVAGSVYWDEVQIGVTEEQIQTSVNGTGRGGATGFDIGFQAFIAADQVTDEDLSGGEFDGILGLALPANSIIQSFIPGSTTGQPDGATFLENLFGLGPGAPIGRYVSMSLERRGDTRTTSSLGLGMYDETLCPGKCVPNYSPVITSVQGPLYWRILLQAVNVAVWPSDPSSGPAVNHRISMPSSTATQQSYPVAVLDSGGSQMLFGNRDFLNSIYGIYNIGPSPDGKYYMSCTQLMSISFTFNGQDYPIHPIDLSDYTSDSSHCMGSMQYAEGLAAGDVILGTTFLKNVYSVYTYPASSTRTRSQPPLVGLVSLTNSSQAASEFYAVRDRHQPLTPDASGNVGITPDPSAAGRAVSGGIIALSVVLGFVALAGGIFCAWFFWLRHKYGQDGVILGAKARKRKGSQQSDSGAGLDGDDDEVVDVVTRARRERKFKSMQRQKSMIDGYSDFDVDTTWSADAADSVTTGGGKGEDDPFRTDVTDGLVTLDKDAGMGLGASARDGSAGRRSRARISAWESSYPPTGWKATDTSRDRSSARTTNGLGPGMSGNQAHDRTGSGSTMATNTSGQTAVDQADERSRSALERFADPPASPSREALLGGMRAEGYEMGVRQSTVEGEKEYADGSILNITDPSRGQRS